MQAVKDKIKAKGVTKAHVAKAVGVSVETLSRILNGKQRYYRQSIIDRVNTYLDSLNTKTV